MNYFDKYDWETMISQPQDRSYNISEYFEIICPSTDYPEFINKYLQIPLLQRLSGVGLLCGTDWTTLYRNKIYYSRLDHSLGVALIIWHFTHNKAQTIAGLLHDVSTPVFSHVSDFRKGDALTQTATEAPNATLIRNNKALLKLLKQDGLTVEQVEDYHKYPVADNEIPQLSADRLEYMFPSGMALDCSWTMEEIHRCYNDISIFKNEDGLEELGFNHLEIAEEYCHHFCMIGHILQLNENKITLHLLGLIMNKAVSLGLVAEEDFMTLSESDVLQKLESKMINNPEVEQVNRLYKTFRTMTKIEHTSAPLPATDYFSLSLQVKQRYINPLVKCNESSKGGFSSAKRLSDVSPKSAQLIKDFLSYKDTAYGCVKLV